MKQKVAQDSGPRVLFMFPHPAKGDEARILEDSAPSERLYGAVELLQRGWRIDYWDSRFSEVDGASRVRLNSVDLRTLFTVGRYGCIVVKDEFNLLVSLAAAATNTPLIYLDSMFALPRRFHKRALIRANLALADRVVCYSRSQANEWADSFGLPSERFDSLPYCIDLDFYLSRRKISQIEPFVLAVGRDLGRDFLTLARSLKNQSVSLKLVTLPYLLTEEIIEQENVEILQRITYEELFELYSRAAVVVVPLKENCTYPSGIRAIMESLSLGKATVSTDSPVLREYFGQYSGVEFVDAYDVSALRSLILSIVSDSDRRMTLEKMGPKVMLNYNLDDFVSKFEVILRETAVSRQVTG